MKLNGFVEKVSAVLMAGVLFFNSTSAAYGEELTGNKEFEVVDNEITYNIKMNEYEESTRFIVTNDSNKDYSEVVINKTDMLIEATNYTYEGTTFLGTELYDEEEEEIDYGEIENSSLFEEQGINYNDKNKSFLVKNKMEVVK